MMTERAFTDREGLSGRPWYKHLVSFLCQYCLLMNCCSFFLFFIFFLKKLLSALLMGNKTTQIYAPSLHDDYGAQVYPGVDDAIQMAERTNTSESWRSVQHEIYRIARVINQASLVLSGGLT